MHLHLRSCQEVPALHQLLTLLTTPSGSARLHLYRQALSTESGTKRPLRSRLYYSSTLFSFSCALLRSIDLQSKSSVQSTHHQHVFILRCRFESGPQPVATSTASQPSVPSQPSGSLHQTLPKTFKPGLPDAPQTTTVSREQVCYFSNSINTKNIFFQF